MLAPQLYVYIHDRPPPSAENGLRFAGFLTDLCDLLEIKGTTNKKLMNLGDFNILMDVSEDVPARKFTSILDDANLHQYVVGPTNVNCHTLALVISRSSDDLVQDMKVSTLMTDHNWVHFGISVLKPSWPAKELSYRKFKNICRNKIHQVII